MCFSLTVRRFWYFSRSPWICVGFLPQTKVTQVRLIGDWKFPKGERASVNIYKLQSEQERCS